jgi:membrane-associated phospholipid phosphatase
LIWPDHARFAARDFALLRTGAFVTVVTQGLAPAAGSTGTDRFGVDEDARDALRARSPEARQFARTSSDVSVALLASFPLLGDGIFNAWLSKESPDVAAQLGVLYAESLAVTLGITGAVKLVVHRERPYGRHCGSDPLLAAEDCEPQGRFESFFSSHTSVAFTAASTSCAAAVHLPLWANTPAWLPCSIGYAVAGGIGTLRISADHHYLTDVLSGAAVGSLVGWAVPLFRFSGGEATHLGALRLGLMPNGVFMTGMF